MKAPELVPINSQRFTPATERTAATVRSMEPHVREALVSLWAEIFAAEIRALSDVTVGSPWGLVRTSSSQLSAR